MKKVLLVLICLANARVNAQTIFWYENFGTGCTQGQSANLTTATPTNGAWAVSSHTVPYNNDPEANEWFISSSEQGQPVGICGGITCGGSNNRTLHIGRNKPIPPPGVVDVGASYFGGSGSYTNKRAESPVIDCSGRDFVQLSFTYILGGIVSNDFCDLECSADGGATWTLVTTIPPTNNSACGLQGYWTFYSIGLPTSCSNNSNVKIGFHWYNNNSVNGSPSIAIDEIKLSELKIASGTTVACLTATSTASVTNIADGNTSFTWAAVPNTVTFTPNSGTLTSLQFPGVGTYSVYAYGSASVNGASTSTAMTVVNVNFGSTTTVSAVSNTSVLCNGGSAVLTASGSTSYTWSTSSNSSSITVSPTVNTTYTVTGQTGYCVSTFTIEQLTDPCTGINEVDAIKFMSVFPNPFSNELFFKANGETEIKLVNIKGEVVKEMKLRADSRINTSDLAKGIYFLKIKNAEGEQNLKLVKE